MPASAVRAVAKDGPGDRVAAVARSFKVSRLAAAIRMKELGLASGSVVNVEKKRSEDAEQNRAAGGGRGIPLEQTAIRNLGRPYTHAVLDAMNREAITVLDATHLLGQKLGTIEKMEKALSGAQ